MRHRDAVTDVQPFACFIIPMGWYGVYKRKLKWVIDMVVSLKQLINRIYHIKHIVRTLRKICFSVTQIF